MEKPYIRQKKKIQQDPAILHYTLQDMLPPNRILTFNPKFNTLSSLTCDNDHVRLLAEEQFAIGEACVLLPLLDMFPYFCPYEVLYSHYYGDTTEEAIERNQKVLERAFDDGNWNQEMRAIRDALSRTRLKLHHLDLDIASIHATGYILVIKTHPG